MVDRPVTPIRPDLMSATEPMASAVDRKLTRQKEIISDIEKSSNFELAFGLDALAALVQLSYSDGSVMSSSQVACLIECVRFKMQAAKNVMEPLIIELAQLIASTPGGDPQSNTQSVPS